MNILKQITRKNFISVLSNNKSSLIFGGFLPFADNDKICEPLQSFDGSEIQENEFKSVKNVRSKDLVFSDGSLLGWNQSNGKYEYFYFSEKIYLQKFTFVDDFDNKEKCNICIYYIK